MTRQQRWQIKMKKEGRCVTCGSLAINKNYCDFHRKQQNKYSQNYRNRLKDISILELMITN